MSTEKQYNGWTNYETWNAKLWMDNEQGSYSYWGEVAQECYDDAEAGDAYPGQTREDAAAYTLSERLKDEHEEATPTVTGFYADLLNAALSEVNWDEIAQSLLEDVDKDRRRGRVVSTARFAVKDHTDTGTCWSRWSALIPCGTKATWIIENTTNNGYGLMCDDHKQSFTTNHPGHYVAIPYTPEDSARLAERLARDGISR